MGKSETEREKQEGAREDGDKKIGSTEAIGYDQLFSIREIKPILKSPAKPMT